MRGFKEMRGLKEFAKERSLAAGTGGGRKMGRAKSVPKLTARQREVLGILKEFDSESWADAWSHCTGWPGGALRSALNFNRTASSLVRKGLVACGDRLEITHDGWAALRAK